MTEQDTVQGNTPSESNPDEYPISPEFWDNILDAIPPWIDEIIALLLVVFGILSFLSILNLAGDGSVTQAWSNVMGSLFGYGSILVSTGILVLGIIIYLPNMGVVVRFPARRIVALEIAFLTSLALMHMLMAEDLSEMRAIARAGQGGGLVGWALSGPVSQLIGSTTVIFIYAITLLVSLGFVIGIKYQQIQTFLAFVKNQSKVFAEKIAKQPEVNRQQRQEQRLRREAARLRAAKRRGETEQPILRSPLMHIKPNLENIPPSMRPGAERTEADKQPDQEDLKEHPLFTGAVQGETFNIIGEIVEAEEPEKAKTSKQSKKSSKKKESKVKRPDGRVKRYFKVGEMDEEKKVGKRDEALPALDLLQDLPMKRPEEDEINTNVVLIENTLLEFEIDIDVIDVRIGPTVTQYAVRPFREGADPEDKKARTRISKIASYQNDLSLALSAKRLRIEAPVPGTNHVGIEVPNRDPSTVTLRSVFESKAFHDKLQKASTPLLVPLGRDVSGDPFMIDLAALPHTLIAGTTGSGKSVCIAALTVALVLNNTPEDVRLIMLDPKMVELSRFNGLPHLLGPVETDNERILGVLRWCTREMDRRYKLLEEASARNINTYNEKMVKKRGRFAEKLPYIVIMVDEVGDLMMSHPEDTEHNLTRLAQMARAVGMHMVVATQRPSVDVLTGLIKANFPGRIAFAVASGVDSRVILDGIGAETLLGNGDMLFLSSDASGPKRLQGCFVNDDEVRKIVSHWENWKKEHIEKGDFKENRSGPWEKTLTKLELLSETDDLLEEAVELVVQAREASASMIQRQLGVGYPRAARIMDLLFELGAIGPPEGGGKTRKVLISSARKDPMQEMIDRKRQQEKTDKPPTPPEPEEDDFFNVEDD